MSWYAQQQGHTLHKAPLYPRMGYTPKRLENGKKNKRMFGRFRAFSSRGGLQNGCKLSEGNSARFKGEVDRITRDDSCYADGIQTDRTSF